MGRQAMAKRTKNDRLQPIQPQSLYPLQVFEEHAGLSSTAIRTARRGGLRVLRIGIRAYILGSDFIDYAIKAQASDK
jgi:hypothetical protein